MTWAVLQPHLDQSRPVSPCLALLKCMEGGDGGFLFEVCLPVHLQKQTNSPAETWCMILHTRCCSCREGTHGGTHLSLDELSTLALDDFGPWPSMVGNSPAPAQRGYGNTPLLLLPSSTWAWDKQKLGRTWPCIHDQQVMQNTLITCFVRGKN